MKFKNIAVGNYFRFLWKHTDGSDNGVIYQKVAECEIRYARGLGVHKYLKNEKVEDLGADYQLPELINFKELTKGHFFVFRDSTTVYQKLTTYYIRQYASDASQYYNENGEVQDLGEEISQFTQPVHVQTRSVKLGK
jgi:hypothetical protein